MADFSVLAAMLEEAGTEFQEFGRRASVTVTAIGNELPDLDATLADALIETLRSVMGEDLGADVEAAWRAAYAELRQAMIRVDGGKG